MTTIDSPGISVTEEHLRSAQYVENKNTLLGATETNHKGQ